MTFFTPAFRTPFTDIGASCINNQNFGKCAEFEMNAMDCLEAYGVERGQKKCANLLDDLVECQQNMKSYHRVILMERERQKRLKDGSLKPEDIYVTPKPDSY